MSSTVIIAISGKMRHGKDTAGDYLIGSHGFKRISFADKLKQTVMNYRNQTPALRREWNQRIARELFQERPVEEAVDKIMWSIHPRPWPHFTHDEIYLTKPEHARRTLQLVAQGFREEIWEDCWVRYALDACLAQPGKYVITDLRYKNEAFAIEQLENAQLWRIHRDVEPGPGADHISETDLDDYPFEVFLDNNGTIPELHKTIDKLVKSRLKGNRPFARGGEVY